MVLQAAAIPPTLWSLQSAPLDSMHPVALVAKQSSPTRPVCAAGDGEVRYPKKTRPPSFAKRRALSCMHCNVQSNVVQRRKGQTSALAPPCRHSSNRQTVKLCWGLRLCILLGVSKSDSALSCAHCPRAATPGLHRYGSGT